MKKFYIFIFTCSMFSGLYAQEICNNGIDDDNDGLVDLNDLVDCNCTSSVPSLIPNPSFELMNCCPTSFSQVNCATSWIQASSATSDYLNTCGYVFPACIAAGLVPFPNGNGILGCVFSTQWQEYVGACLTSPMLAGTPYTLQMDIASTPIDNMGNVCNNGIITFGPVNVILYGTTNCANLPFAGTGCPPSPQFVILGQFLYTPVSNWGVITITFTPTVNITGIVIGSPCVLPASYTPPSGCYPYFYFDNLLLNSTNSFNTISQTGSQCANNIVLSNSLTPNATYQWYLNGVALLGETNPVLNVSTGSYPPGNYTVVVTTTTGCSTASSVVAPSSIVVAIFTNSTVCVGDSTTFTDNSTTSTGTITGWSWNFGDPASAPNNTSALQNPSHLFSTAGTYNVTLIATASNGCTNTASTTITVNPLPVLTTITTAATICIGGNTIITASGATTYTWMPGNLTGASIIVAPIATTTYTITGTNSNGCVNTTTTTITVNPFPVVTTTTTATSICIGGNSIILASGATTYNWMPGNLAGTTITISPTTTTTYTVTGTDANGCVNTTTTTITVNPLPTIQVIASSQVYCTTDLVGLLSGNPSGGLWNGPGVVGNTFDPSVAGFGFHTVVYTYTDNNSCTNTASLLMTVNACVGINEITNGNLFSVYPNPATNEINVKADASLLGAAYTVIDNVGKVVLTGKIISENTIIELGNLSSGVYMLNIGDNLKQTFKVIKE